VQSRAAASDGHSGAPPLGRGRRQAESPRRARRRRSSLPRSRATPRPCGSAMGAGHQELIKRSSRGHQEAIRKPSRGHHEEVIKRPSGGHQEANCEATPDVPCRRWRG
jgi:hypothetical protein